MRPLLSHSKDLKIHVVQTICYKLHLQSNAVRCIKSYFVLSRNITSFKNSEWFRNASSESPVKRHRNRTGTHRDKSRTYICCSMFDQNLVNGNKAFWSPCAKNISSSFGVLDILKISTMNISVKAWFLRYLKHGCASKTKCCKNLNMFTGMQRFANSWNSDLRSIRSHLFKIWLQ